jgi:hypothetical protein
MFPVEHFSKTSGKMKVRAAVKIINPSDRGGGTRQSQRKFAGPLRLNQKPYSDRKNARAIVCHPGRTVRAIQ